MNAKLYRAILATLVALPVLSACGGGGNRTSVMATTVSSGQQLIDLKKAFDEGVITMSEYENKRRAILAMQ